MRPWQWAVSASISLGASVPTFAQQQPCTSFSSQKAPAWSLVKGTDAKGKTEAASFSHLKDDAKGQSKLFAGAVIWRPWVFFDACPSGQSSRATTSEFDVSVGGLRDTTTGSEANHVSAAIGWRSASSFALDAEGSKPAELVVQQAISAEYKRKRLTDGSDRVLSGLVELRHPALYFMNDLKSFPGPTYKLALAGIAGAYDTKTTGNVGASAANGSYAGLVIGLKGSVRLSWETQEGSWPLKASFGVRRQIEHKATGAFSKADYDLGEISLLLPIGKQLAGDLFKPQLALTHTQGTDRMGGKTWVRQTKLELTVSYGL